MEHLAIDDIAAYLEQRLDEPSRRRIEAHLVECPECRHEVMEGERTLRSAPQRRRPARRRPLAVLATLAAAAVVLFTVLPRGETTDAVSVERTSDLLIRSASHAIIVVEPADSARLAESPTAFVWRRAPEVSLYKLTLTDEQGRIVWDASTRDTVLRMPDSLATSGSARYYWYVDALRADGGAVSSGVHGFRVR